MVVNLFLDGDGDIWFAEFGENRRVAGFSDYDYATGDQVTEDDAIATAIAESTDDESGAYRVIDIENERQVRGGGFNQDRTGVTLF